MKKIVTILLCFFILILTACHAENFIHGAIAEAASYSVSGNELSSNEETEIVLKSEKADFTGNGIDFDIIVAQYNKFHTNSLLNSKKQSIRILITAP